jgi:hypothetical protein
LTFVCAVLTVKETMVDIAGGHDGPIEHGFSNSVFIIPGIIILGLSGELNRS